MFVSSSRTGDRKKPPAVEHHLRRGLSNTNQRLSHHRSLFNTNQRLSHQLQQRQVPVALLQPLALSPRRARGPGDGPGQVLTSAHLHHVSRCGWVHVDT